MTVTSKTCRRCMIGSESSYSRTSESAPIGARSTASAISWASVRRLRRKPSDVAIHGDFGAADALFRCKRIPTERTQFADAPGEPRQLVGHHGFEVATAVL